MEQYSSDYRVKCVTTEIYYSLHCYEAINVQRCKNLLCAISCLMCNLTGWKGKFY